MNSFEVPTARDLAFSSCFVSPLGGAWERRVVDAPNVAQRRAAYLMEKWLRTPLTGYARVWIQLVGGNTTARPLFIQSVIAVWL